MLNYKCHMCGGELSISPSGELVCPYCGAKLNFSDAQLREYKEFRFNMLKFLASAADRKADENATRKLWDYAERIDFVSRDDGQSITIEYLYETKDDGITMYMAKSSIIYVFEEDRLRDADRMLDAIAKVRYPSADMKGLSKYIPELIAQFYLKGNRIMLVFSKEENMYPLGAFGSLSYRHSAWILSRLENLCCVLEYSDLFHNGIRLESICINPFTHEAALYGGWWNTVHCIEGNTKDLEQIRETVLKVLGTQRDEAPKPFLAFLKSRPERDAYTDFAKWDEVIERKLGGRHFARFESDSLSDRR